MTALASAKSQRKATAEMWLWGFVSSSGFYLKTSSVHVSLATTERGAEHISKKAADVDRYH